MRVYRYQVVRVFLRLPCVCVTVYLGVRDLCYCRVCVCVTVYTCARGFMTVYRYVRSLCCCRVCMIVYIGVRGFAKATNKQTLQNVSVAHLEIDNLSTPSTKTLTHGCVSPYVGCFG